MPEFRPLERWAWPLYRLRARWRLWKGLSADMNRRAAVEIRLWDAVSGKKPPPDAEECRALALKLGVPEAYRQKPSRDDRGGQCS